jgi:uncharacterized membrane protein YhaH (DUF805 family)
MQLDNPYQTPTAEVADRAPEQYSEISVFSPNGRLGRVRYFAYGLGFTLVLYFTMSVGAGIALALNLEVLAGAIAVAGVVTLLALTAVLTIQRCHDFGMSGWLSLLLLVPLVNLLFWIVPGTRGPNGYGSPPPPNSRGVIALAALPVVVIGILAAIAIPAYQDFSHRAERVRAVQAEGMQPQAGQAADTKADSKD